MKLSKEFQDRIKDSGIDPLQFILNIMQGKEFNIPHPFLQTLYTFVECIQELNMEHPSLNNIILNFLDSANLSLAKGYVPIELRARAGLELMQYCYPKRKSIEITATPEQQKKEVDKLIAEYDILFEENEEVVN